MAPISRAAGSQRKAVAEANKWFAPGLVGAAKGERAMANFDEDAVTLAVEAARDCLPEDRTDIDAIYFASTSMPFSDRQNAGIVAAALQLSEDISSADVSSSQRAGLSALTAALDAVAGGRVKSPLVAAGEKRKARAASPQELSFGDAAAAFTVGGGQVIAKFLGSQSRTLDFVDHFRGEGEDFDYGWEERWIRDEGYSKIVPATIKALLAKTGVSASDVAHFILPCPFAKLDQAISKQCGIDPAKTRDNLAANVGDSGSTHALLMLAHALESAKPGEKILVAQFGQGCDALLFEVTDAISNLPKRSGVSGALTAAQGGDELSQISRLQRTDRAREGHARRGSTSAPRYRCSTARTTCCSASSAASAASAARRSSPRAASASARTARPWTPRDDYGFSEKEGTVLSWSADFLTYSMDPPNHYGMITFAEGGRFMTDITDVEQGQIDTGTKVRMSFRVKDRDEKRGFVR